MCARYGYMRIPQSGDEIQLERGPVGLNAQVTEYAGPTGLVQFIDSKESVLDAFPKDDVAAQEKLEQVV